MELRIAILLLLASVVLNAHGLQESGAAGIADVAELGQEAEDEAGQTMLQGSTRTGKMTGGHRDNKTKQAQFFALIRGAKASYCSKNSNGVFCQLVKGLKTKFIAALKSKDTRAYRSYVLRLNVRYCTGPKKNLKSRRCQLIPAFLDSLPPLGSSSGVIGRNIFRRTAAKKYQSLRAEYATSLGAMSEYYCKKEETKFCAQLKQLQTLWSQASSKHDNKPFRTNFQSIKKQYCERPIDFQTKRCNLFKVLSTRLPPAMKVVKPETKSVAMNTSLLTTAQAAYRKSLKDAHHHYCAISGSNPHAAMCEMVTGMMQSFKKAVGGKVTMLAHKTYMSNVLKSVCMGGPTSKRCSAVKILVASIPGQKSVVKQAIKPTKVASKPTKAAIKPTKAANLPKPVAKSPKVREPPKRARAAKKTRVKRAESRLKYLKVLRVVQQNYCKKKGTFCQLVRGLTRHYKAAMKTCSDAKYVIFTANMMKQFCGAKKVQKRCKLLSVLREKRPLICTPAQKAALLAPHAKTNVMPGKNVRKKKRLAHKHKWGEPHLANLTPGQQRYQATLRDIEKHYCSMKKVPFCQQAKKMRKVFNSALKMQYDETFQTYLSSLKSSFCAKSTVKTKLCKVITVLDKKKVSVSHMGPYAVQRLTKMQLGYLSKLRNIYSHYCGVDDKSLFCQLCRGLERTYKDSLKHRTNIKYEGYLTNIEKRYCKAGFGGHEAKKRCAVFPILRRSMPISMTTLHTLPEKHLEFINTVTDVEKHFCGSHGDTTLLCEASRGVKRVFIHGLNGEDNSDFDFYLSRLKGNFCATPSGKSLKQCQVLPVLKNGLPPAFLAEGVKRNIDGVDAREKTRIAQAEIHTKLVKDRSHYLKTLQDIQVHYCKTSDRTYFCMLTRGLTKNYAFSLVKSHENWEYSHYLAHMKLDFCVRGHPDRYDKRCKFIPMLIDELPMSINDENRLFHEQQEYVKAMQDIVGHFCTAATKSLFCQLCHGLVRHYVATLTQHTNTIFNAYLDNMHSKYCVATGEKSSKRCKLFPILRHGIPGTGLERNNAVRQADSNLLQTKAALRAAIKIRRIAQASVKSSPGKHSLMSLETATKRELQAEKAVQLVKRKLLRREAELNGSPTRNAVQRALALSKDAEAAAMRAKASLATTQSEASTHLTQAKAKVLQATLQLAAATKKVQAETSPENIKAVQTSMQESSQAKDALKKAKRFESIQVQQAQKRATADVDESMRAKSILMKMKHREQKIVSLFTGRAAQKAVEQAVAAASSAKVEATKASHKVAWLQKMVTNSPTLANKQKLPAAIAAAKAAANKAKTSAKALLRAQNAKKAAIRKQHTEMEHAQESTTAQARSAVKVAQIAEKKAKQQEFHDATLAGGNAAAKFAANAKKREQQACATANALKQQVAKAKTVLSAATARLKVKQSPDTISEVSKAHKSYSAARSKFSSAQTLCLKNKHIRITFERSSGSAKSPSDVSAKTLEKTATKVANAFAAVAHAKHSEANRVTSVIRKLDQRVTTAKEKYKVAQAKVVTLQSTVLKLTGLVARAPTAENIDSLKHVLASKKKALASKSNTKSLLHSAEKTRRATIMKMISATDSSSLRQKLSAKLKSDGKSAIHNAKAQLKGAQTRSKHMQKRATISPTPRNVRAAQKAAVEVKSSTEKLKSATDAAYSVSTSMLIPMSVSNLKGKLRVALKRKTAARHFATAHPSDENLDAFRKSIRQVNELESRLLVARGRALAKAQKTPPVEKPIAAAPKHISASHANDDLVSTLLAYYCSSDKYKNLCSFYKKYQKIGWKDITGRMSKHLLTKVAEAKKAMVRMKQKLVGARAASASTPTKANILQVKQVYQQYRATKRAFKKATRTVKQFMKHQSDLTQKMRSATATTQRKVTSHIGKLIQFYCARGSKHTKLCSFYKSLKAKRMKEKDIP